MARKLIAALVFALVAPASALACSDKAEAQNAQNADVQPVLVAQADPAKPPGKPVKKKAPKKKAPKAM
jgi:hypothetical protein